MSDPAQTIDQNILPIQGLFNLDNTFNTFIGQGQPFIAPISPDQSGLRITNSTINSTTIGATTPSSAAFTTATVSATPVSGNDVVNKTYLEYFAAGISWKQPVLCGTTANITLSGLQTINGVTVVAGDRVLVKNQGTASENGIYLASATAWSRAPDADAWNDLVSALVFIETGSTLAGSAWYCTAQPGGTLGVTAVNWSNFSVAATYTAGTGLTLADYVFSITNTGVSAGAYGSASKTLTATVNAQGQLTVLAATDIAIANTQVSGLGTMSTQNANSVTITGGTLNGVTIGGSTAGAITGTTITANTQFSGAGTGLTGTASGLSIGGSAGSATTATNLAGGASGSLPYQSGAGATTFLAAGTNGQYLTLSGGVPTWSSLSNVVSSFSGGSTGLTPATATTGAVTLAGTLAVANGGTGVTSSSGATSVVLRDSNSNITGNAFFAGFTSVAAAGTTTTLTAASTPVYVVTGSGGQTFQLPNATTLPNGTIFSFNNNQSSGAITVNNASGTLIVSVPSGGYTTVVLLSNGTSAGTWDRHDQSPSNVSWSTNTLDYAGSITSATWNGTTIAINRGGTNGTATPTAGTVAYGTGTAYAFTAAGTSGQVLQSNGASAPTWVTPAAYATVTDDTTTNATRYPLFASVTTGNLTTEYVSSTKLKYNPSTGALTASQLIIAP
jgi:hypothetical protein